MSEVVKLRTRAEIEEEAATWIWRMEDDGAEGGQREAFEAWLRRDPRHRRAIEELSKTWDALDGLTDSTHDENAGAALDAIGPVTSRNRRPLWFAAAARLMAALVGGVLWL